MSRSLIITVALYLGIAAGLQAQEADFGDAPDGQPTGYPPLFAAVGSFPSLLSSNGARALDITRMTLGPGADLEADALTVNADTDDGVLGMTLVLTGIPPSAKLEVDVSAGTGGTFFLNVLIDLNMDGQWPGWGAGGEHEWVVRNVPVTLAAGGSRAVTPPLFAFGNGNRMPDGAWMRIALTDSPVETGWDGSGGFAAGEIEDFVVRMPEKDGKTLSVVTASCPAAPLKNPIKISPGGTVSFQALVGVIPGPDDVGYSFEQISGGVLIRDDNPGAVPGFNTAFQGTLPNLAGPGNRAFFTAQAAGALPSKWHYRFWAIDPLSIVTATAIIVGFGDPEGEVWIVPDEPSWSTIVESLRMTAEMFQALLVTATGCTWHSNAVLCEIPQAAQSIEMCSQTQVTGVGTATGPGRSRSYSLQGDVNPVITGLLEDLFPCGQGPIGFTVCALAGAAMAGPHVMIIVGFEGEIPLQRRDHQYQYGLVFDADGSNGNNYMPSPDFPNDFFAYTDKWYELLYNRGSGWSLKVTDVRKNFSTVASNARVVIAGSEMAWFVPRSELDVDTASWRVTSFAHTGDYGLSGGFWSADYYPLVQDSLVPIAPPESLIDLGALEPEPEPEPEGVKAPEPYPADGAVNQPGYGSLVWLAGNTAVSHDVYFGRDSAAIQAGTGGTYQGRQTESFFTFGLAGFAFSDGLSPGTTYYWRIDEIEADGTKRIGLLWSFVTGP